MIMRDVMQGMLGFTRETCRNSEAADMNIISVEEKEPEPQPFSNNVIPFPRKK